ncbi:MAG: hypothetical protein GDA36_07395 [Rhodobacteraceae bacterium]|nr:hypothetical protein [Paracoccaceae bacterium]
MEVVDIAFADDPVGQGIGPGTGSGGGCDDARSDTKSMGETDGTESIYRALRERGPVTAPITEAQGKFFQQMQQGSLAFWMTELWSTIHTCRYVKKSGVFWRMASIRH